MFDYLCTRQRFSSCRVVLLWFGFIASPSLAWAVEEASTLILYNQTDQDSIAIRDKYLEVHPGARAYGLSLSGLGEEVPAQTYLDEIRLPLLNHLNSQSWGDQIDTIVTTKGLPLRIDAGASTEINWQRFSSLESELARLDSISTIDQMGSQDFWAALADVPDVLSANPYYLGPELDPVTFDLIPYAGPQGFDRSDPINENIRLTSRLDGYTRQDVFDMIDRAQSAYLVPFGHAVVVDEHPASPVSPETAMSELALNILPSHNQLTAHDATNSPIISSSDPVIGYVSHGVHSGLPGGEPGNLDETGYIVESLDFDFADGAVFHTYESFNAFSFDPNSTNAVTSQGQVAQWIAAGGTAGLGHVQEPTASKWTVTNEDIFFDMMLSGHTLAEAAWAATRQLSFVNTVIGDPLMRWKAWIPGDTNLDGLIDNADAGVMFGNWGRTGLTVADGNVNGDDIIDSQDGGIIFENWSPLPTASFAAVAAPEPTSIWIAISGLCGFLAIRRRVASS